MQHLHPKIKQYRIQTSTDGQVHRVSSTPIISTQSPLDSPSRPQFRAQMTPSVPVNSSLHQAPKVSFFSGESHKGDVSVEIWEAEVISLRSAGYSSASIMYAIRRSLRGRAADLVLSMGIQATIDMVLDKFHRIFGTVSTPELLLEQYYSSRQLSNETVAEWACRLEEILHKLEERGCPVVGQSISMLRSKFWSGLRDINVKNALRHMYDSHVPDDDLLVAARRVEQEATSMTAFSSQINAETSSFQKLVDEIAKLNTRIDQMSQHRKSSTFRGKCFNCQMVGHKKIDCRSSQMSHNKTHQSENC